MNVWKSSKRTCFDNDVQVPNDTLICTDTYQGIFVPSSDPWPREMTQTSLDILILLPLPKTILSLLRYLPGYFCSQFGSLAEGNDTNIIGHSDSAASSKDDTFIAKILTRVFLFPVRILGRGK